MKNRKTFIIGLDCADPDLIFNRWKNDLPNLSRMIDRGYSARMRSTDPPITIPAWTSMMSSKSPGTLGIYGFRNRKNYSYDDLFIANGSHVNTDRLWDIMTKNDRASIVIGVPQTYPPRPLKGYLVSGMMTPSKDAAFTWPKKFKNELYRITPDYMHDVPDFRSGEKMRLLKDIYGMTAARFKLVRHMLDQHQWDFFMFVEMGVDRIHHAFWHHFAADSPDYVAGNQYEQVIYKYYQYIDMEIGTLLKRLDPNTDIIVVSDHGAKTMKGGFCINEWLIREGYLTLKEIPEYPVKLTPQLVDWNHTKAWAEGGYYGRLFLNVKGREPRGIVLESQYQDLLTEIRSKLNHLKDDSVTPMKNRAFTAQELYPVANGIAPDLFIYFDDLAWRSIGNVGMGGIYTHNNDTGPDGANHDYHGIFIMNGKDIDRLDGGEISIYDIAPTILTRMGLPVPEDMEGEKEKLEVRSRK